MVIDAHHHLWRYTSDEFGWIADDCLRRDFSAGDLGREILSAGVDRTIVCEARQCIEETDMLLRTAAESRFIAGVVGWLPIAADDFGETLNRYLAANAAKHGRLVGVRHVVQDEPDDAFILRPDFMRGVRLMRETGLVYDILVFQRQLANAVKFVDGQADDQQFVLDHVGKPMLLVHPPELLDFVKRLKDAGVTLIDSAVFNGGFLMGSNMLDYREADPERDAEAFAFRDRYLARCREWGLDPAAVAVEYAFRLGFDSVALNTSKPKRVAQNARYGAHRSPEPFWNQTKLIDRTEPDSAACIRLSFRARTSC